MNGTTRSTTEPHYLIVLSADPDWAGSPGSMRFGFVTEVEARLYFDAFEPIPALAAYHERTAGVPSASSLRDWSNLPWLRLIGPGFLYHARDLRHPIQIQPWTPERQMAAKAEHLRTLPDYRKGCTPGRHWADNITDMLHEIDRLRAKVVELTPVPRPVEGPESPGISTLSVRSTT